MNFLPVLFFIIFIGVGFFCSKERVDRLIKMAKSKIKVLSPTAKVISGLAVLVALLLILQLTKLPLLGDVFWYMLSGFVVGIFFKQKMVERANKKQTQK